MEKNRNGGAAMTIDQLSKRVRANAKHNQANKTARANAERLIKDKGVRTLAEALGLK